MGAWCTQLRADALKPPAGAGIRNRLKSLRFEVEAGDFCFGFVSLRNCIK
jgi:hypothetical protein